MITILSFYKLKKIKKLKSIKKILFKEIDLLSIKGLIILSPEGINGTLSGSQKNISVITKSILSYFNISKFDLLNITHSKFVPFLKAKIKIKSEVGLIDENDDLYISAQGYFKSKEITQLYNSFVIRILHEQ